MIDQSISMGWRHCQGDLDAPVRTGRSSVTEFIQEATLRRHLLALNELARPWLARRVCRTE